MTKILYFIRHTDIQITWVESHPQLISRKQGWQHKQYGICLVSWSMCLRLWLFSWFSYWVYWGASLLLSSLMTLTIAECTFFALYFGCSGRCCCDVLIVYLNFLCLDVVCCCGVVPRSCCLFEDVASCTVCQQWMSSFHLCDLWFSVNDVSKEH